MFEQHASIGIMVWDQTSTDSTEIIQNADVALYEAKSHAKGHHVVFTLSMHERVVGRVAIVKELRHALHAGELAMHYQPIVNLATTEVVGFEALMRWQHPERGWVPPVVFIPMAEQSELILELGSFALREAVAAAISWGPASGQSNLPYVTVNLSAHQFHDPDMVAKIEASLATGGLAPGRLILEITESAALLEAADAVNTLAHLHRLGVGIALDDFGTGFSSLSYIVTLDPKIIKIDQSFVRPRQPSDRNDALLKMIVSLGNSMQMTMLAEGIETPAQLEQLRQLGCELGQGYLFSRAVPADQAAAMVGKSFVIRP
jgi:EAL domain-containing protein (putative c-di-GMP-specific phosphodiesterase class I)